MRFRKKKRCIANNLNYYRITRSDMNCQRVKYILRGLTDHERLETLDFSHCKISDDGAASVAKFISRHENLRNLLLVDNIFGNYPCFNATSSSRSRIHHDITLAPLQVLP